LVFAVFTAASARDTTLRGHQGAPAAVAPVSGTHRPIEANLLFIRERGIKEFARLELEKQEFLRHLLANYDECRSKSFYCTSCQLMPLDRLKEALKEVEAEVTQDTPLKEKAKALRAAISNTAERLGINLRLRK